MGTPCLADSPGCGGRRRARSLHLLSWGFAQIALPFSLPTEDPGHRLGADRWREAACANRAPVHLTGLLSIHSTVVCKETIGLVYRVHGDSVSRLLKIMLRQENVAFVRWSSKLPAGVVSECRSRCVEGCPSPWPPPVALPQEQPALPVSWVSVLKGFINIHAVM